ncbi:bifunctional indole-3-glycerol-phosphate synthase TrpC/phosphoribosylanthranilate isomerase TrpF [Helicobacter pylori]|uniref:Multifunctional fusion protein n=1 Tax=Helicobacter pylori TaxID=210 RepID=A0ABD6HJC5_HELPX|nr:bifunctional indole-3-glycerol-phosphate synthase TrpC/phosphoribosylanthranilate isomerase TrpF [Helicobacter pylori]MUU41134.1 bifunctional indole-3-glycerol-phosphate synthase TrpC/phosphoribosylanthranilate isomerase TrpF [Helicobacter pylori]WQV72944.1 bifunctional indole-3-glycerol-phosphate synthase TrpC/phosphoribosylanthranilate isomerase TrpF [Helicobacter pylori]
MPSVLENILKDKLLEVSALKKNHTLPANINPSDRDFKKALLEKKTSFILECKKASPSKGLIRKDFDLLKITKTYEKFASCISVLADSKHFLGSYENIKIVSQHSTKPILCKDFIIDAFQIKLARMMGANAVLLMLSVLDDKNYLELFNLAKSLNMSVLTEVSNQQEIKRLLKLQYDIIGINNRDLHTLKTDIFHTLKLRPLLPKDALIISESGIYSHAQIKALAPYVNGFLVGSSLMKEKDLKKACAKLILGENKVCGLTRIKDAKAVYKNHFIYGGLIFEKSSPRYIKPKEALKITKAVKKLDFVGVFVKDSVKKIQKIAKIVKKLDLKAVQLYGYSPKKIAQLKKSLPKTCAIWQVVSVADSKDLTPKAKGASLILYDTKGDKMGGNGVSFDWEILENVKTPFMLAGGLNLDNIQKALKIKALGLDFNSGLEISPGIKNKDKIKQLARMLREY